MLIMPHVHSQTYSQTTATELERRSRKLPGDLRWKRLLEYDRLALETARAIEEEEGGDDSEEEAMEEEEEESMQEEEGSDVVVALAGEGAADTVKRYLDVPKKPTRQSARSMGWGKVHTMVRMCDCFVDAVRDIETFAVAPSCRMPISLASRPSSS
jgi:hypothetical protein